MVHLSLFSSLTLAGLVAALPAIETLHNDLLVEHERAASVPDAWRVVKPAPPDDVLSLRIAVKEHRQINPNDILARSNPQSSKHGQYLSAAELKALLDDSTLQSSRDASWERVRQWLANHGIHPTHESQRGFDIRLKTSEAERLFNTRFSLYSTGSDDAAVPRTEAYSLPSSLQEDIDYVYPTVHFFKRESPRTKRSTLEPRQHGLPTGPFDCSKYYCPVNLTERYNIDYLPTEASDSKLAIGGFLEQYTSHQDWETFISKYGLSNPSNQAKYDVITVNGGESPDTIASSGVEAMLDLEYTTAFTGPLKVSYYSVGGRPPTLSQPGNISVPASESENEPYLEFLDYLLEQEDIPQVISISYTDDEQTVPYSYATKVCERFSYLALRGVSVLIASGDAGTQGTRFSECKGPDNEPRFIPTFPASCPWVTTVGATADWGGAAGFSSGGFSNYFERPSWQDAAVESYVKKLGNSSLASPYFAYNTSGRGYPDLTLLGTDYLTVYGNFSLPVKGTSASTPVIASMIALINDIRLKKGLPVLGFLNPLLYADNVASAFRDVTEGQINGCANADHQQPGYEAVEGWDAASGLGEPDFSKLRELLTSHDGLYLSVSASSEALISI
ncbi:tripeptidyl-peptidase 1 [Stachybotrys elegans]|uniref:tripeptidyl-peptidase II n=1 Tax=Stachybotrys elegans TaxID=80388 RepID=A0A8K0SZE2_9HYPO|nr:tripeptidyl-peptidase 1 [Stachybotrys elegans]